MTTCQAVRLILGLSVVALALAPPAAAQTNDEIFPTLQWNFSTPGARANGMGRTFIGMADDATAAITNPAGLMSLTRPQVYAEYKNTRLKVDRLASVDSLFTQQPTTFASTLNSLSFLGASAPLNSRTAVGFSIHRFLDYHETFNLAPRSIPNLSNFAFFPVAGSADFTGIDFAGSVAYMVTSAFRIGVTVGANSFKADSVATRNAILFGPTYPPAGTNRNDLATSQILANQTSIHDRATAISASVGALYRVNEMVSVGADFTKSPKFSTSENLQVNNGFPTTNLPLTALSGFPVAVSINVPNHFGAGVAVRPNPRLLVAADVVRVQYSSLSEKTAIIFSPDTLTSANYAIPDVTEVHFGGEYNIVQGGNPIFVRAGVFTNPNHLVSYVGSVSDASVNAQETAKYNLLQRKNDTRGTIGLGFVSGAHLQVDVAYVFGKEFVASAGVRF